MPATTYSPFWGPNANDYSVLTSAPLGGVALTAMFNALIGAAPGAVVTATRTRVGHKPEISTTGVQRGDPGSPILVTVTEINRASTAADVTTLKNMTVNLSRRPSYPVDRSGNGGKALV